MNQFAVVLAGGKGTRLGSIAQNVPKPMVRIKGEPFLYWQLRYLSEQGVTEVLLLVSHLAHVIQEHFALHPLPGLKLHYSVEPQPMGTGGALSFALPQLPNKFWLLNGDSFLYIEMAEMWKTAQTPGWQACMAVATTAQVPVPGNLKLQQGGLVTSYKKEAGAAAGFHHVDAGVYLMNRRVVEQGPKGAFDMGEFWPPVIAANALGTYAIQERFFDIGTPERLKTFEAHLDDYF